MKRRQDEEAQRPLPPRRPPTEVFAYPTQLYFLIMRSAMSRSSELVEKLGNNTVRIQRNGIEIKLSKEEYDSLEPVNPPSRFRRFEGSAVQRRDQALELGLRLTTQQSFLTPEDLGALSQTNRVVLEGALESNINGFRGSFEAKAQFLDAIKRNDRETLALFEKYQAPDYYFRYGHDLPDNIDPDLLAAMLAAVEVDNYDLAIEQYRIYKNDEPLTWEWRWGIGENNLLVVFRAIMRKKNLPALNWFLRVMPDEQRERGMEEWFLVEASKNHWEEATKQLSKSIGGNSPLSFDFGIQYLESPLPYWIRKKNLRMVIEILQRRPAEQQRGMLRFTFLRRRRSPLSEALLQGADGLNIVRFILSKSVNGSSVCGVGNKEDGVPLIIALHARDALGNDIEAPTAVVAEIIRDYRTNYFMPEEGDGSPFNPEHWDGLYVREFGLSPLIACCTLRQTDTVECARMLLDAGADPNESFAATKNKTPLIEACRRNNLDLVRLLLDRGADPNLACTRPTLFVDGREMEDDIKIYETPLFVAIPTNNRELLELLLTRGANPEQKIVMGIGVDDTNEEELLYTLLDRFSEPEIFRTVRFLIAEKGFRSEDSRVLFRFLKEISSSEEGKKVSLEESGITHFKLLISGMTPAKRSVTLDKVLKYCFDATGDDYTILYANFLLSLESPPQLKLDFLFDAIDKLDLKKVQYLLSKGLKANVRVVFMDGFVGDSLAFAKRKKSLLGDRMGGMQSEEKLQKIQKILSLLEQ
jgi:hypothetical protein